MEYAPLYVYSFTIFKKNRFASIMDEKYSKLSPDCHSYRKTKS